ncbi:Anthranilate synthase alpha subunit 1 [Vigna angularis]|uniref:anthranilate synthase n=2 Tax=Phaseolus angularis TaxID=3914 RepID=A0A8T0L9J5_PHAAN|nr:Anthranilate synthase alpha subunit 1 [Vigna angularis]
MFSATIPMSLTSATPANAPLSFSRRVVPPGSRFSPVSLTGISFSRAPFTLRCSSLKNSSHRTKFEEAAKKANLIPLYQCIFSDHLTPVVAHQILLEDDDREAPSFLFESDELSCDVGRYSVVGAHPAMEVLAKENKVAIIDHVAGTLSDKTVDDPIMIPREISEGWKPYLIDELPDAFCGGWAGFFSYDTVRYVEKKKLSFLNAPSNDKNFWDMHLGLYESVIVFDHVEKKAYLIQWVRIDRYSTVESAYNDGMEKLEKLAAKLQDVKARRLEPGFVDLHTHHFGPPLKKSSMTTEAYKEAVLRAKEHINAGDIFQIVLSQRFERRTFADPFEIYRALRVVNPSPYMAYLQARGCILVASSPEILTRIKKNKIVNRPLAGTTRRGNTPEEDARLEEMLLKDEKQRAEHVMLVDLGRNDVGKVAKSGSVKVEQLMNIERYSHVMHISSTITGEMQEHLSCWDVLRSALPVGTVSGAPKVKAMELIDKMEVTRRGPYGGGFGYISFFGEMDIALALRTMVIPTRTYDRNLHQRQEWVAYLQAGAGIVADSVPADEYQECQNKAAALARAIDLAESAFVHHGIQTSPQ